MKKLLSLVTLCVFALVARAQTVAFTVNTPPCNGNGVVTATFTGLSNPFTVYWVVQQNPAIVITHTVTSGNTDQLTGWYGSYVSLSAYDGVGGQVGGNYQDPPFTFSIAATPAACPALGTATATVTGGTAPYTYQWYNPATMAVVSTSNPASLAGGPIGVTITDANGCVFGSLYTQDTAYVPDVPAFSYSVTTTQANCTNGTATVGPISGGLAPYTYLWSNGATATNITGLMMGYYNVTVTDANGCHVGRNSYIQQAVNIPVNVVPTNATCVQNNGAAIAFPSGGVPPYTYHWSTGAVSSSISGLTAGIYFVTATDANGCIGNGDTYVNTTTPITVTYSSTASSCTAPTGTATVVPAGGVAPYSITWGTYPVQTGATASSLLAGTYSFHITDANGCVRDGSVVVAPQNIINVSFSNNPAYCTTNNGSITAYPSGGGTPYTYAWSNGATTQTDINLAAGSYAVTITDNIGCSVTRYSMVDAYSPVYAGVSSTDASCVFSSDGTAAAVVSGGTTPYTYSWSNGSTTPSITGLLAGNYSVFVSDAAGCTASNAAYVNYNPANDNCYCTIEGTIYDDANNNCTQDPGENGINHIQVHCSGFGYTYTDASGHYSFIVPSGSYIITEDVETLYPLAACQANNVTVAVTAASGCTHTVDFANTINTIHDMQISTWDCILPVPGHSYTQSCLVSNQGTVSESAILAGYTTDGQIGSGSFSPASFTASSPVWSQVIPGALTLAPGASQYYSISYSVPANIPLNTSLVFADSVVSTAPVSNWVNDYTPWDNVNYFTVNTVASYDPNFKEVSPKGTGPTGLITYKDSVLQYMVHFQNTGTAPAENIVVLDTLDQDLDWSTLKPIYSSFPCRVSISEAGGVAKFDFEHINLPTETSSELGSTGMFTYTVHTRHNLAQGTQFTNSASIYFDYNAPVKTNTTLNTLGQTEGVNNVTSQAANTFSVYPNPASGSFYVQINSAKANADARMAVTDIAGKTVMTQQFALQAGNQAIQVNTATLTPGVYFVNLHNGNIMQTQKLVIIK